MANTSPDGLWSPDASDPLILRTLTAEMQASNQVAFGNRQLHTYRWSNSAARNAQAGMRAGDEGFQADTGDTWRFTTAWKLWMSLNPGAITASTGWTVNSYAVRVVAGVAIGQVVATKAAAIEQYDKPLILPDVLASYGVGYAVTTAHRATITGSTRVYGPNLLIFGLQTSNLNEEIGIQIVWTIA